MLPVRGGEEKILKSLIIKKDAKKPKLHCFALIF